MSEYSTIDTPRPRAYVGHPRRALRGVAQTVQQKHRPATPPDTVGDTKRQMRQINPDPPTRRIAQRLTLLVGPGRPWSYRGLATAARRAGLQISDTHVRALCTGGISHIPLYTTQILGEVLGLGSMGLIEPLEGESPASQVEATLSTLQDQYAELRALLGENPDIEELVLVTRDLKPSTLMKVKRAAKDLAEMEQELNSNSEVATSIPDNA